MSAPMSAKELAWSHPSEIPFARPGSDSPAVCDAQRNLTATEFAAEVDRVAGGLAGLGIERGDVVAVMLPNRGELVVCLFAAWRLGAACTPINPVLTADEACYQVADSGAKVAVAGPDQVAPLEGGDAQLVTLDDLAALSGEPPVAEPSDDDTALLIYTSGTTGRPKGVVIDHANVRAMVAMLVEHFDFTDSDRALVVMPLFHANGLLASILAPLGVGGSTVILGGFSKSGFWGDVEKWRPTYFSMVPAMYLMLNAMPEDVAPDTSSLRVCVCGAAPVPPDALTTFNERYGVPIVEGYGLSETTVATNLNPLDGPQRAGSVGPPLNGVEIRIVDDEGAELPTGEPGEVTVMGPNVMRAYLGKPEETAETLRDGWLHTGDVGYVDEDNYLFLVDRKKDMILRGGENIYPKEIEHSLTQHPSVQDAAVVARPDDVLGEVPVAFVEPAEVDGEELRSFLAERLAKYKVPVAITGMDELPRNPVGKLDKPTLRTRVKEEA